MDIIEQAAKRLEELRRSGADVPPEEPVSGAAKIKMGQPPQAASSSAEIGTAATAQAVSRFIELKVAAMAAHGVITPDAGRSHLADEMRIIKRPLLLNAEGKSAAPVRDANLIMITSAVPG